MPSPHATGEPPREWQITKSPEREPVKNGREFRIIYGPYCEKVHVVEVAAFNDARAERDKARREVALHRSEVRTLLDEARQQRERVAELEAALAEVIKRANEGTNAELNAATWAATKLLAKKGERVGG